MTGVPPSYQMSEFAETDVEAGQLLRGKFSDAPDIQVEMNFYETFSTVTLLQLVTRHPNLPGQMADGAVSIGLQFQMLISQTAVNPELNHVLELGWHPEFDVDQDGNPINEPIEGETQ